MINIGTLSAFVLVSIGVVVLRHKRPDLRRGYRVPFAPVLPIVSALLCFYLMLNLTTLTWVRFVVWLAAGVAIYFAYGRRPARGGLEADGPRSEERRVGKECGSTGKFRWSPDH